MKGYIVRNRYYTDEGMDYAFRRMCEEFARRGVGCAVVAPMMSFGGDGVLTADIPDGDFAVFWDKDAVLNAAVAKKMRCFNTASAVTVCDDKVKTFAALDGLAPVPRTLPAPLMYPASDEIDEAYLAAAEALGFPLIVKERVGSRGEQVHLVRDAAALKALYRRIRHVPFQAEEYIAGGEHDMRLYVVGGRFAGAVARQGKGFKSNVYAGADVAAVQPPEALVSLAERIAAKLGLDYCAADFIGTDKPVLVEVNSNAYFTGAEACGLDIAGRYAAHITEAVRCS